MIVDQRFINCDCNFADNQGSNLGCNLNPDTKIYYLKLRLKSEMEIILGGNYEFNFGQDGNGSNLASFQVVNNIFVYQILSCPNFLYFLLSIFRQSQKQNTENSKDERKMFLAGG
jgi:hypothetical protein